MTLTGSRREAASGNARSLVILLHGYGADGADLIGLADPLAPYLPDTLFLAPNAPDRSVANPMGYQWFPIPWIDGSSEAAALAGRDRAAMLLNAYLDDTEKETGIAPAQTVLIGFSQGTMMSLHVAPRRKDPVAGVVGFSGRLMEPDALAQDVVSRPPVLLVHGDMDEVVPASSMPEAAEALTKAGIEVRTHVSPGTGHGIAPDGLSLALAFVREKLG